LKFSQVANTIQLHPEEAAFCKQGGAKQKLQDLAAAKEEEIKELRRQLNILQKENATLRAVTPEPKQVQYKITPNLHLNYGVCSAIQGGFYTSSHKRKILILNVCVDPLICLCHCVEGS
jgi:hypothetical protein